jgi:hypothetical protein
LGRWEEVLSALTSDLPHDADQSDVGIIRLLMAAKRAAQGLLEVVLLAPPLDGLGQALDLDGAQRFQLSTTLRKFWKIS